MPTNEFDHENGRYDIDKVLYIAHLCAKTIVEPWGDHVENENKKEEFDDAIAKFSLNARLQKQENVVTDTLNKVMVKFSKYNKKLADEITKCPTLNDKCNYLHKYIAQFEVNKLKTLFSGRRQDLLKIQKKNAENFDKASPYLEQYKQDIELLEVRKNNYYNDVRRKNIYKMYCSQANLQESEEGFALFTKKIENSMNTLAEKVNDTASSIYENISEKEIGLYLSIELGLILEEMAVKN